MFVETEHTKHGQAGCLVRTWGWGFKTATRFVSLHDNENDGQDHKYREGWTLGEGMGCHTLPFIGDTVSEVSRISPQ